VEGLTSEVVELISEVEGLISEVGLSPLTLSPAWIHLCFHAMPVNFSNSAESVELEILLIGQTAK
jgi:hypothetical protein